jgi:hypothetical protein
MLSAASAIIALLRALTLCVIPLMFSATFRLRRNAATAQLTSSSLNPGIDQGKSNYRTPSSGVFHPMASDCFRDLLEWLPNVSSCLGLCDACP